MSTNLTPAKRHLVYRFAVPVLIAVAVGHILAGLAALLRGDIEAWRHGSLMAVGVAILASVISLHTSPEGHHR